MNIDPTTGLPELPEGYFWEVKPYMKEVRAGNEYGGYSEPWEVPEGYEVCIVSVVRRLVAHAGTITRPKVRWWQAQPVMTAPTTYVEEEVKTIVKSMRLIDPVKQAAAEAEYMACGVWDLHLDYFSPVHYEHITPEIILEAATKLYAKWQDELEAKRVAKAKRAASEALVGVYPPKALP